MRTPLKMPLLVVPRTRHDGWFFVGLSSCTMDPVIPILYIPFGLVTAVFRLVPLAFITKETHVLHIIITSNPARQDFPT